MPVSRTENLSCTFSAGALEQLDVDADLAALGELHGVVDEVGQDLPQPNGIAEQVLGDARRRMRQELEPLVGRLLPGDRRHRADDVVEPEVGGFDVELAGLDLGEVEDVVDDRQQRGAGVVHLADVVALLRRQRGLEGEVRQADDGVHGRADLVAHVRQEHRLHRGGFFGLDLGRSSSTPPATRAGAPGPASDQAAGVCAGCAAGLRDSGRATGTTSSSSDCSFVMNERNAATSSTASNVSFDSTGSAVVWSGAA